MKLAREQSSGAAESALIAKSEQKQDIETPASSEPSSLTGHAVRGGILVGSSQLVRIGVQLLSVVVLSRLLSPEDFGLVASVAPVIGFVSMFQDLGYGQAIIQRRDITQDQISSIFWTTTTLGSCCALAVILASPGVAWFFHDSRLLLITIAASLIVFLGSMMSVPSGLLNRRLHFKGLAVSDALGAVSGLACAVLAAYMGARYWSLIISSTVSSLVIVIGYWTSVRWKPSRPKLRFVDKEIGSFGANLTGFTFVNYFAKNLDNLLIGHNAGTVELGYYDRAYKLLYFPIQNINGPLYRVMTPLLSRVQDDKSRFREMFLRSSGQLTLLIVPAMAALVAVPHDFVILVFGNRWAPVAPIFFYLGINGLLQPLGNATGWIFISQGRTDVMFRMGIVTSLITVGSFVVGLHLGGAVGLAAAYAFSEYVLKTPIQYVVLHRLGPVTAWDLCWHQIPLLLAAGFTLGFVHYGLQGVLGMHGIPVIASSLVVSYIAAVLVTAMRPAGKTVLKESRMLFGRLWNSATKLIQREASA